MFKTPEEINAFRLCLIQYLKTLDKNYDWGSAFIRNILQQKHTLDTINIPNNIIDFISQQDINYIKKMYSNIELKQSEYEKCLKAPPNKLEDFKVHQQLKEKLQKKYTNMQSVQTEQTGFAKYYTLMLKMYACIGALNTSIFLSVPPSIIKKNKLFELFASPLNFTNDYCSLFLVDKYFGSYGNFFEYELQSGINYLANPPFDENIMNRMVARLSIQLAKTKIDQLIITIPVWDSKTQRLYNLEDYGLSFPAFDNINKVNFPNYVIEKAVLLKKDHKYYNHSTGKYINASNTHLIVLSPITKGDKGNKIQGIIKSFKTY